MHKETAALQNNILCVYKTVMDTHISSRGKALIIICCHHQGGGFVSRIVPWQFRHVLVSLG